VATELVLDPDCLILGLFYPVIGVLAAMGFVALTSSAPVVHLRANDPVGRVIGAVVFALLAATSVVLHTLR
jgi:DoxX-like protein